MNIEQSPILSDEDLRDMVRRQVHIFGGVRACARNFNCHAGDITHFLKGNRGPSPMLLEGLGIEKVTYYVYKPHVANWAKERARA